MGHVLQLSYAYGIVLQIAALVHFIRRRPDGYWLWIILIGGGLGSAVYLVMEAAPDLTLLRGSFNLFYNPKRIQQLEWLVEENPAPANYEELGVLYMQQKRFTNARECFTRAIKARGDSLDPFYRRAQCCLAVQDYSAAIADLEHVVRAEANYDYYRAASLLAECYGCNSQMEKAGALLEQILRCSTLTEAQLNYALFLAEQSRPDDARHWAQRILAKKAGMPHFQRRAERPLFRRAEALLKKLPTRAQSATNAS
jgi:hypothetical protein